MDKQLEEIIEKKITETFEKKDEISNLVNSMNQLSDHAETFALGIVIGRLYNSFYYQCRRILKRNPTNQEFSEFLEILKKRQKDFQEKLR